MMIIYTGRFQPFHNGHLFLIKKLRQEYPDKQLCLAVIKDVQFEEKTEFDKIVDVMLSKGRNPFNSEITLSLIEETIKAENLNNVTVTLMPRASKNMWGIITSLFDCERIWVFTKNQDGIDEWEESKVRFYQSMGDKVIRMPIVKDINGSDIRKALSYGDYEYLKSIVPRNVYEYLKQNLI